MNDLFGNPPPHRALSVRQPWAHLIVAGIKRIENRVWTTRYRGPLLIHAGRQWYDEPIEDIEQRHGITIPRDLPLGGVVGVVDLVDVVTTSSDPYFAGPFGLVLAKLRARSISSSCWNSCKSSLRKRSIAMIENVALSRMRPEPDQPRKEFCCRSHKGACASIAERGLIQPITLRPNGSRYMIVAGECRFRAHQQLGRETIRAEIVDVTIGEMQPRAICREAFCSGAT